MTKSVELVPNNKEPIKNHNCSVTLSNKLLLTNSTKIGRLSSGLISHNDL
jgi:hypothetical protein